MVGFALSELGLEEESVGDRDVLAAPEAVSAVSTPETD